MIYIANRIAKKFGSLFDSTTDSATLSKIFGRIVQKEPEVYGQFCEWMCFDACHKSTYVRQSDKSIWTEGHL